MKDNQINEESCIVQFEGPGPNGKEHKFLCNACRHAFSKHERELPYSPLNGPRGFKGYVFLARCPQCGAVINKEVEFWLNK